jgi:hypothetical protein
MSYVPAALWRLLPVLILQTDANLDSNGPAVCCCSSLRLRLASRPAYSTCIIKGSYIGT